MHPVSLHRWQHSHTFGQDQRQPGEARTLMVIALTAATMVLEVAAGLAFGSMALLADGLHMASHATALGISAVAYIHARRHAHDANYSFGTGKINALGGFTGAVLLAVFALMMAWESSARILHPVQISFNQAILVAVLGLLVNGASVLILGHQSPHEHHDSHAPADLHHNHDHNLRAAYLHVLADALTSLLAIFALLGGKYVGLVWLDPVIGIVGAVTVSRWSLGLLSATSSVLLDRQGHQDLLALVKDRLECDGDCRVADLHLWSVGPGLYAAIVSVVAENPKPPERYKQMIPSSLGFVHVSVEVHQCVGEETDHRAVPLAE
jgi:cation diffusion facilitator family transporter